jgi:hypothetical protein
LAGGWPGFNRLPHLTQKTASPTTCVPHLLQVTIYFLRKVLSGPCFDSRQFDWSQIHPRN